MIMSDTDSGRDERVSAGSSSLSYGEVLPRRAVLDEPFTASPAALAQSPAPSSSSSGARTPTRSASSTASPRAGTGLSLDAVRDQVAESIAVRALTRGAAVDGTRVGVVLTLAASPDPAFLRRIADKLRARLLTSQHLFALGAAPRAAAPAPLLLCASDPHLLARAAALACAKLTARIAPGARASPDGRRWLAQVAELGARPFDEDALWDVVRKAARAPVDPLLPPPGSVGIAARLALERARLERLTPQAAYAELTEAASAAPAVLVDIRPAAQRQEEGALGGALVVERNVLEWRFDPRSDARLPVADRYDLRVIVFCSEGYTSSLAAASLRDLGLLSATDIVGGYKAWREAGLPAEVEVLATGLPPEEYSFS
ncbi:Rhodanese-like protein [Phanerochaete sordida]|uniref:Rhodanese-like protein n=1 Tax=Phanerochaete sordida TaxID=48140 RepID=A0A9P3GJE9_9APHY|nr:Rhodanese-like protein [Phanerochaete sordida]